MFKRLVLPVTIILISSGCSQFCFAGPDASVGVDVNVDRLSSQIAEKELDLIRLTTNLRIHELPRTDWGQRGWAMQHFSNAVLTAAGAFMNAAGRYSYLHKKRIDHAPRLYFVQASWVRVMANIITTAVGTGATSLMAMSDLYNQYEGVDPGTMRKYASHLQQEIDSLLARRNAAVLASPVSAAQRETLDSEGRVLLDVRNLELNEFARFYGAVRGNQVGKYVTYVWATASNANAGAGGMVGNYAAFSKHGSARQRERLPGTGGLCDVVSAGMNWIAPLVARGSNELVTRRVTGSVGKQLDGSEPGQLDTLHSDEARYHRLVASEAESKANRMAQRDSVFALEMSVLDEHEKLRLGDEVASWRTTKQNLLFSSSAGPAKLANGIGVAFAAFDETRKPEQRFRSIGGPAFAYGAGYSVGTAAILGSQLDIELRRHRALENGTSPGQVLRRELSALDGIRDHVVPVADGRVEVDHDL